jgi:hypothetical protein
MPTAWETFPVEFRGGLITNISPLQQGITIPGSARRLTNFEPSIEGGYRRIEGFNKFDTATVPVYGEPVVQGSGQTGTTLVIANIYTEPQAGDTLTISGVTGTYTIATAGVSYSATNKTATLTLTTSLASSPADKAAVTFANRTDTLIEALIYFRQKAIVYRGSDLWESDGTGFDKINTPSYGTVLVNGGSQTGTSLVVDGLTGTPQQGDTFSVAGIEKVYTITSAVTVTSGGATLTISPALATSPADNAVITFLSCDRSGGGKHRFTRYNFLNASRLVVVDGSNYPFKYDGTTFTELTNAPSDVLGAAYVVDFKNQIFFAKGNSLTFTAPYTDDNFSVADGAGVITVPHSITGLIVFREQLIVFSTNAIHRLVGNTVADFQLQPISQDIGCVRTDTIQEVGGDVVFLGPDGLRLLSATDRIGDFGFAVASRPIQSEVKEFVSSNTSFCSCVIRSKNQYRIFGYAASRKLDSSAGILGVQFADQTAQGMAWAETRGIFAYVADSIYSSLDSEEVILFAHKDGYVYRMESGNSFDGASILALFSTPYFPVTDPRLRKTFYKLTTYLDPSGSVTGSVTQKLDFDATEVIQPPPFEVTNQATTVSFYGSSTYGTGLFGGKLKYVFNTQLVGAGFTTSLQYTFEGTDPPFSLDALTLEFLNNDRQ